MTDKLPYPEGYEDVVETWQRDGLTYTVVFCKRSYGVDGGHYCGYVRFPKRPVREQGYNGILTWVPVHGGITYAESEDGPGMVYGFDCAHSGDDSDDTDYDPKVRDLAWLKAECERMGRAIALAAKYERRYLRNVSQSGKAKVIDEYHDELRTFWPDFKNLEGLGAMIHALCGVL